jgi:integrase
VSRRPFKRRGRAGWAIQYVDQKGRTRQRQFKRKQDADDFADLQRQRDRTAIGLASDLTFEAYAKVWLRRVLPGIRTRTAEQYAWALEHYLIPAFGPTRLDRLQRSTIKEVISGLRREGQGVRKARTLSKRTVAHIWATLRTCLGSAADDGLILQNPAARLGRLLHLAPTRAETGAKIRALDPGQLKRFLDAATLKLSRRDALLLRLLALTGMRSGEGAALQWEDIDLEARTIHVRRTIARGDRPGDTKTGAERTVDLSAGLTADLEAWAKDAKAAGLQAGARAPWVFATLDGGPADPSHLRKRFARALEASGLPGTFTPHSLRHTYASQMLAAGEPLAYVQEQLGHADVRLTVHLYGRWLRKRAPGAVDRMEEKVSGKSALARAEGVEEPQKAP